MSLQAVVKSDFLAAILVVFDAQPDETTGLGNEPD